MRSARSARSRELWIAGTRPPAKISTPLAGRERSEPSKRRTGQADLVDARNVAGAIGVTSLIATNATPSPASAAPAVSTPLSTRRCCSSRPRDAPSALRIASSRLRLSARATSRLMALAQAIRSTQPTAASTRNERRADVADHARFQILNAPRGLLVLIRRLPDGKEPRVGGAQRSGAPPRGRHPVAGVPSAIVKKGPLRLGAGQRAAVNSATVVLERPFRLLQHADDGVARAVDGHRTSEHRWIAPEPPHPVRIREHRHVVAFADRPRRRTGGRRVASGCRSGK